MNNRLESLTKREKEVLQLIKNGMTNKEIAKDLCISEETVQNHVKSILSKYGVHDRKKLIVEMLKNN